MWIGLPLTSAITTFANLFAPASLKAKTPPLPEISIPRKEEAMSYRASEQTLETVRMLGTLKCVARYDFTADDGEVYYISDYTFGKGKHLHVCLLNVTDSYFRIAPLRYLTEQPRSSWYVNDTKIDTEAEIGPQLPDTMREWLNSNPWKEFTSFDPFTGRRLQSGVDKIKRYACCGCAVGTHKQNPEEPEDHKHSPAGGMAGPSIPSTEPTSNGESREAGSAAGRDRYPASDNSAMKGEEVPKSSKSPLHNGVHASAAEQSSQQATSGTNTGTAKVNRSFDFSAATMAYQATKDRQRISTIIDASLKARGFFASPDVVDAAYDAGFRTCTDAEGFGEWCKLWNIARNLPEGSSDTKETRQSVPDAPYGSIPQGMMMINMDLVPLEHREFVAQWCKPLPAPTPTNAALSTSETSCDGPQSTETDIEFERALKRAFEEAFGLDTTSNKKRVRSCGEMSLWQSCYSQAAHPVQRYGSDTTDTTSAKENSSSLDKQLQAEKRAKRTPISQANKSGSSFGKAAGTGASASKHTDNASKLKAVQGIKRKNEDDHDGFRNFVAPEPESSTTQNEQSQSNEQRVLRTPSSPSIKSRSSSRGASPSQSGRAGSPSKHQETRGLKRKDSNEHPRVLHSRDIDFVGEDEVQEANVKASPDVMKTRKIAYPSSDLDRI